MSMAVMELFDWLSGEVPGFQRTRRGLARARSRLALAGCELGDKVLVHGPIQLERQGEVVIGRESVFVGGPFPTALHVRRGARLVIGSRCYFNYGVQLDVHESVRMGNDCMFGSYVRIIDAPGKPVRFGDDVWVAHGAVINPGVTIGDGAVISAGSVVTSDVPPGMLAIGTPARCMSQRLCSGGSHV